MDKFNIKIIELKKKYQSQLKEKIKIYPQKNIKKLKKRSLKIEINKLSNTTKNKDYWEDNFFLPQTTRPFSGVSGYSSLTIKEKKEKLKNKLYSTIRNSIEKVNSKMHKEYRKSLKNRVYKFPLKNEKFDLTKKFQKFGINNKNEKFGNQNFQITRQNENLESNKKRNIYENHKLHNRKKNLTRKPSFKDDFKKIIDKYERISRNNSKGSLLNKKNHSRNISLDIKKFKFRNSISNKTANVSKRTSISNNKNLKNENIYKNFVKRKIDFVTKNSERGVILNTREIEKNSKSDLNLNLNLNVKLDQKIINFKSKLNKLFMKNCDSSLNSYSNNIYKKISRENVLKNNSRSFLHNKKKVLKKNKSNILKKKIIDKINKNNINNYLIKDLIISINNYLLKNKKDKYIQSLKKNYTKLQKLKKYNLKNHKFIYSLNLNISLLKHKIEKKRYLILDLDETLIFSSKRRISSKSIFIEKNLYVNKRPYLKDFLRNVSKRFNLILFTASEKKYAEKILKIIDKKNNLFMLKFFRQDCVILPNNLVLKNLEFLQNLNLKNLCIVDNSPDHFFKNLSNCVPIVPFFGDLKDMELIYLDHFLKEIVKAKDYRKICLESFFLKVFLKDLKFEQCLKNFLDKKRFLLDC